jgi:hypothetical protein
MSKEPDFIEIIPKEAPYTPKEVLDKGKTYDLEYVLVIGQTKDGQWYFNSSDPDIYRAVFSVNSFKEFLTR